MGISLYTSRVVLAALGVEDYGIYNVVGGIVSLFAFINGAMALTTTRYIAYELGQEGKGRMRQIFSSSVMIHLLIAFIVFCLAESIGLYLLEKHFTIPPERMNAARWVYQFSVMNCIIMILSTPYNGAIIAYEKMQAFAYISLLETVLRLFVAYAVTYSFFDNLIVYAFLLSVTQLLVRICYTLYCRMRIPDIRFCRDYDKRIFKQMLGFSGWTLFNNASIIACGQGVNILLNMFFNPMVNAARGIAVQVEMAVSSFSKNFQTAVNPQITKSYASGDIIKCHSLIMTSSKFAYFLMLLLTLPLILETDYILNLWLTVVPEYTVQFIRIILLISLLNTLSEPLNAGVSATGKIKYFQSISGLLLISILPVSYFLFRVCLNPLLVFNVYFIASVLVYLYKLLYVVKELDLSFWIYLKIVVVRIVIVSLMSVSVAIYFKGLLETNSLWEFVGNSALYSLSALVLILLFGLNKQEKYKIVCILKKIFSRLSLKKS